MTESSAATYNTAGPWAAVGIQADQVHNSTVYQVLPDDPPHRKYEIGVRHLEYGVPTRARELICDAIAHGHDGSEVRFHWVLAMLSKRSYRDLTFEERERLGHISTVLHEYADDEWKRALKAICELLDCLNGSGGDPKPALQELLAAQPGQRDKIVRHLDLVLTGGMKDSLWAETRQVAENTRFSADRLGRIWAYFQVDPAGARVRTPAGDSTTPEDKIWAVAWSSVFGVAVGYLGWLVLMHATPLPILAYLLTLAAGYVAARNGLEWRYRVERLRTKDRAYFGERMVNRAPEGGFANRVDHSFTYYFTKYAPEGAGRDRWLCDTAGIRNTLRDEIVEIYRERRVNIDHVNWLIRYLVRDVRKRWAAGNLLEYREQYRTARSTKAWCSLSLAALVPAVIGVITAATSTNPLPAATATLVALATGRAAAAQWLHIISEHRRSAEDHREYDRLLTARLTAFHRWKRKLDATRPSEDEMESWLNCDKTMLLNEALRHYRLAWRDIIAHAVLLTPARDRKRARQSGGPWRYSKYDIRLFLITQDGVREINTELDFERSILNSRERNNFRFDAVSSVHVVETGKFSYTLELTLTNGPTRNIRVTDPEARQPEPDEDADTLSEINLDAAGFTHTLHILEGIAAEGKGWIDRTSHTEPNSHDPPPTNEDT